MKYYEVKNKLSDLEIQLILVAAVNEDICVEYVKTYKVEDRLYFNIYEYNDNPVYTTKLSLFASKHRLELSYEFRI